MPDGQATDETLHAALRACLILSLFLWLVSLFLPIAITSRQVDEFGSTAYGWECALMTLVYPMLLTAHNSPHRSILQIAEIIAVCGIIPCSALFFLIGRIPRLMALRPFQPILAVFIAAGLAASYFVMLDAGYRPLYGYYIWLTAVLLFTLSELASRRNRGISLAAHSR